MNLDPDDISNPLIDEVRYRYTARMCDYRKHSLPLYQTRLYDCPFVCALALSEEVVKRYNRSPKTRPFGHKAFVNVQRHEYSPYPDRSQWHQHTCNDMWLYLIDVHSRWLQPKMNPHVAYGIIFAGVTHHIHRAEQVAVYHAERPVTLPRDQPVIPQRIIDRYDLVVEFS